MYTGGPKSGTAWHDYDGSILNGGYPLSEPRPGDVVLVRRGVKKSLGIGVVYKNDFERSLSEQSKLHVIWVNKNTRQLTGQTARFGFSRTTGKTLEAFHSTDSYEATFDLLRSLDKGTGARSSEAKGEVRDRDLKRQDNRGTVEQARNQILYGPPGTGKTYDTARHALAIIDGTNVQNTERDHTRFRKKIGEGQIQMITFHQNFAYEDFVEGIRPVLEEEELRYELHDGVFKSMACTARDNSQKNYVLIIDEINRGNIAKIFGELITLIEDSRREKRQDETKVTLPYSGHEFCVPDNLYIIGTMNTADRSIQLLDTALRRRFEFKEMMPESDHPLIPPDVEGVALRRMLGAMNERITLLLDREHQIGHTYLFGKNSMEELSNTFQNKIFPLLQEYFFDDWPKIRAVLGGNGFVQERSIDVHLLESELMDEDKKIYERLPDDDPEWLDPAQYRKIYEAAKVQTQESS